MATPMRRRTDEERDALDEWIAQQAAAEQDLAPAVEHEPPPAPEEPDALDQLVRPRAAAPATTSSYEAPPERSPDTWQKFLLMAMDLGLNKGRNLGAYVSAGDDQKYDNWMRRDKAKTSASMRDNRGTDPQTLLLREQALELQRQRLGLAGEAEKRRGGKLDRETDAAHPDAERLREFYYSEGVPRGSLDDLSLAQMKGDPALKNVINVAQAPKLNDVAADRAQGVAEATEQSKIDVAAGTAAATQPFKIDVARETAGIRTGEKEEQARIDEEKAIAGEQRKRGASQQNERATLEDLKAQLEERAASDPSASLPAQGHVIERAGIKLKADLLGGSGMNDADTRLDNGLVMAGLQNYVHEGGNAPNTDPERAIASAKFRGNGTVGSALAAVNKRLAQIEANESQLRSKEESGRRFPRRARKPWVPPAQSAPTVLDDSALEGL